MTTDIHTLAGPYALDAVNDIERAAFSRHLAECESCAVEVAELREVTARLADGTWAVPPPHLRQQVFTQIRRTRQAPPGHRGAEPVARPRRSGRWLAVAAAAAVLAAGSGAAVYAIQEQRVRQEQRLVSEEQARRERIEQILSSPDARLSSKPPLKGPGLVTVVYSERLNAGVVRLTGMSDPGQGKAYQMWTLVGEAATDAGLLPTRSTGGTQLIEHVRGAENFGLSLEPASGSKTPSDVVAIVPLR
jgi:anti-sigma-K factor RskA